VQTGRGADLASYRIENGELAFRRKEVGAWSWSFTASSPDIKYLWSILSFPHTSSWCRGTMAFLFIDYTVFLVTNFETDLITEFTGVGLKAKTSRTRTSVHHETRLLANSVFVRITGIYVTFTLISHCSSSFVRFSLFFCLSFSVSLSLSLFTSWKWQVYTVKATYVHSCLAAVEPFNASNDRYATQLWQIDLYPTDQWWRLMPSPISSSFFQMATFQHLLPCLICSLSCSAHLSRSPWSFKASMVIISGISIFYNLILPWMQILTASVI
jgi:hypothetical protein